MIKIDQLLKELEELYRELFTEAFSQYPTKGYERHYRKLIDEKQKEIKKWGRSN